VAIRASGESLLSNRLISEAAEALLAPLFHAAQARHLKAGERLFAIGDPGDGCYRLDKGVVKVSIASSTGEERIIALLAPGAVVGELSMIDGLPQSASVVALQDSVVRFVGRRAFEEFANAHPEARQALLAILSTRLRQVHEALAATSFMTVKGRVARALLELAQHVGQPSSAGQIVFKERISRADLAAMAGVARENVSRVLSDWRRRKFVTGSGRGLCLKSITALEREMNSGRRAGADFPLMLAS
jgi:CRP/FNR family cyclic AMP-dependent transcriptional regulator